MPGPRFPRLQAKFYTGFVNDDQEQRYDILFAGECLEGHEAAAVREAVGKLFAADAPTVERLFSGKLQRIKRNCDRDTARTYRDAMQRAGAKVQIKALAADGGAAAERAAPTDTATGAALSLAPAGTDVLTESERAPPITPAVETEHLSLAEPHERLMEPQGEAASPVPGPDFDLAPVGSQMSDAGSTPAPAPPDTTGISLVEGELDLSDCAPESLPAPLLYLDDLALVEPGKEDAVVGVAEPGGAQAPDTRHFSLEPMEEPEP